MRVLLTGATGFIGQNVLQFLAKEPDVQLVIAGRNRETLHELSCQYQCQMLLFDFQEKRDDYFEFTGEPDLLIHLAWGALDNFNAPSHVENELTNHLHFLKNMIEGGLKDVTVSGTCLEYGLLEGKLMEEFITKPITSYGVAKDLLRKSLEELHTEYNFSLKWLRYFYMYGEGQSPKAITSQLKRSIDNGDTMFNMSGGEQRRDYLSVENVAEFTVRVALQNKVVGVINICSGNSIAIKDFIQLKIKELKSDIKMNLGYYPYPTYEPMEFWGDSYKITQILNK